MAWRLVGGNHWELARSPGVFATLGQVAWAIEWLRRSTDRALVELDVAGRVWSWRLSVDGELVAVAGRVYQRKQTCAQAAAACLGAIPVAQLAGVLRQASVPLADMGGQAAACAANSCCGSCAHETRR